MRGGALMVIGLLAITAIAPLRSPAAENDTGANPEEIVKLKGEVTPVSGTTNLQFRVESGPIYKLLSTRDSEALFADTNLQNRILLVKGRVHSKGPSLEVIGNLHTIRDGKVYELYYYCDICAITTSFPGLCLCCREPVVLMEKEVNLATPESGEPSPAEN